MNITIPLGQRVPMKENKEARLETPLGLFLSFLFLVPEDQEYMEAAP